MNPAEVANSKSTCNKCKASGGATYSHRCKRELATLSHRNAKKRELNASNSSSYLHRSGWLAPAINIPRHFLALGEHQQN